MESTESRAVSSVDVGKDLQPIILEDAPKLNPEEIKNEKYVGQEKIEHQNQLVCWLSKDECSTEKLNSPDSGYISSETDESKELGTEGELHYDPSEDASQKEKPEEYAEIESTDGLESTGTESPEIELNPWLSKDECSTEKPNLPDSGYISSETDESKELGTEGELHSDPSEDASQKEKAEEYAEIDSTVIKSSEENVDYKIKYQNLKNILKPILKKIPERMISYLKNSNFSKFRKKIMKNNKFQAPLKSLVNRYSDWPFENKMYNLKVYPVHVFHFPEPIDFSLGMRVEFLRLRTFSKFSGLPSLFLAKGGFFYDQRISKVTCFTCDKCYSPKGLITRYSRLTNSDGLKCLHEKWCLISDHGNIAVSPSPETEQGMYKLSLGKLRLAKARRRCCQTHLHLCDTKYMCTIK